VPSKDTEMRHEWKWLRVRAAAVTTKHVSAVGRNVLRKCLACVFDFRQAFVSWVKTRLSRRETLLPCSVDVVQALGIRCCAVGKEAGQKADDGERMNIVK
jgi:hypothetical protein